MGRDDQLRNGVVLPTHGDFERRSARLVLGGVVDLDLEEEVLGTFQAAVVGSDVEGRALLARRRPRQRGTRMVAEDAQHVGIIVARGVVGRAPAVQIRREAQSEVLLSQREGSLGVASLHDGSGERGAVPRAGKRRVVVFDETLTTAAACSGYDEVREPPYRRFSQAGQALVASLGGAAAAEPGAAYRACALHFR